MDEFQQQIRDLDEKLSQKTHEVEVLQTELKLVKEFRKKRAHMQKELDEVGLAPCNCNDMDYGDVVLVMLADQSVQMV